MGSFRRSVCRGAISLLALLAAAPAGAQVGGPPTPPVTLWQFLGIPQGIRKVQGATRNRRGNHPNREPKPPLKALADPANLESKDPSIKKAAEIKQAEDLKRQKIKAVKYLASIGCGCYDVDGGVTAALVASMSDCTEDVRYETINAIAEAAEGECCANCGKVCCCNKDILTAMAKIAYERDDHGCFVEPSARVRQAAAEALVICCPNDSPPVIVAPEEPVQQDREAVEGEMEDDSRESAPETPADPAAPPPPVVEPLPTRDGVTLGVPESNGIQSRAPLESNAAASGDADDFTYGVVVHVSLPHALAHVHFENSDIQPGVGSEIGVYQNAGGQRVLAARLQVVESFPGSANVTGSSEALARIARGDMVLHPTRVLAAQRPATIQIESASASIEQRLPAANEIVGAAIREAIQSPVVPASSEAPAEVPAPAVAPVRAPRKAVAVRRPVTASFMR